MQEEPAHHAGRPCSGRRKGVQLKMTFGEGSKSQDSGEQVGVGSTEGLGHLFLLNEKEEGESRYGH